MLQIRHKLGIRRLQIIKNFFRLNRSLSFANFLAYSGPDLTR